MDEVLQLATRRRIHDAVEKHPGSSAREVQRLLSLGWGETSYHLDRMVQAGALRRERTPSRDFYFTPDLTWDDRKCLVFFRGRNTRRILLTLLEHPGSSSVEVSERLVLGRSTVFFHLTRLLQGGIVVSSREAVARRYQVAHPEQAIRLLAAYRDSFGEELVSRFAEVWGTLLPDP